eukprot:3250132-Rhodomonas_salina.1
MSPAWMNSSPGIRKTSRRLVISASRKFWSHRYLPRPRSRHALASRLRLHRAGLAALSALRVHAN